MALKQKMYVLFDVKYIHLITPKYVFTNNVGNLIFNLLWYDVWVSEGVSKVNIEHFLSA